MHIIVNTATSDGLNATWLRNAAGHTFSRRFGFGRLDADKLVDLAQQWKKPAGPLHICESNVKTLNDVAIIPSDVTTIELETDACFENSKTRVDYAEHVQLFIDITHPRRGDLNITLVSPSKTHSVVLSNRPYDTKSKGIRFAFTSIHFWGEPVRGTWKVLIGDNPHGLPLEGERKVNRVGLALLGTVEPVLPPAGFIAPTLPPNRRANKKSVGLDQRTVEIGEKVVLDGDDYDGFVSYDSSSIERKRLDNLDLGSEAVWERILTDPEFDYGPIETGLRNRNNYW